MDVLAFLRMRWAAAALLLAATPADAAPSRVWVSGDGVDTPECGIVIAPCRSFQFAHDLVAPGGEIYVRDPGDFGPVRISKSISIINDRAGTASATAESSQIVSISAGAVLLRGLTLDGKGTDGIGVLAGSNVTIENCYIRGFLAAGIANSPFGMNGTINIRQSIFERNRYGLDVTLTKRVNIRESVFLSNDIGVRISNGGPVSIDKTVIANNKTGIQASNFDCVTNRADTDVRITDTLIDGNKEFGIRTNSCDSQHVSVMLSRAAIANNPVGITEESYQSSGLFPTIYSYGNNNFFSNGQDLKFVTLTPVAPK